MFFFSSGGDSGAAPLTLGIFTICFSRSPPPSGADRAARTSRGHQALHVASENGHTETVRMLLDNGADPNAKDQVGVDWIRWSRLGEGITVVGVLVVETGGANVFVVVCLFLRCAVAVASEGSAGAFFFAVNAYRSCLRFPFRCYGPPSSPSRSFFALSLSLSLMASLPHLLCPPCLLPSRIPSSKTVSPSAETLLPPPLGRSVGAPRGGVAAPQQRGRP